MSALELKEEGNNEFKQGNYLKAAAVYTKGIKIDPKNAVFYSNRCAALLKLSKVSKAMADAEECIALRPEWEKGYFRKACVLEMREEYPEALAWYRKAAECNPSNKEVVSKIRNLTKLVKSKGSSFVL
ncbi:hypothetical protein BSKO_12003 [Bryopsis sp. KO-2023]|nr:hypothetical protein BSKO_12003 [Bryopsis sp. KO-2023]